MPKSLADCEEMRKARIDMKFVIAMDSFKGSLTSMEAGNTAKEAVLAQLPDARVVVKPLADGGEGTMEALMSGLDGEMISVRVQDPLGREKTAKYAIVTGDEPRNISKKTAVIEMAQAAGLTLLSKEERDAKKTSTFGVGQMICDALDRGCRDFVIGIGGSATNDGGIGMLRALGVHFYDRTGECAQNLMDGVQRIDISGIRKELAESTFRVACDVDNPLCGPDGATYVYAEQKGLQPEEFEKTDAAMASYAEAVKELTGQDNSREPGAGAAGGMGFALLSFLDAKLIPGAELVMLVTGLSESLKEADVFLTGEGRIDSQTAMGKAPWLAGKLAKRVSPKCRVYALTGQTKENLHQAAAQNTLSGFDGVYVITPPGMPIEQAMQKETAMENMRRTVMELKFNEKRRD